MAVFGYVRVSSTDQNEDRQIIAEEVELWAKKEIPLEEILQKYNICKATFYRRVKELELTRRRKR